MGPVEIHAYLSRVMYGRRNKMDPLWNQLLVAGFDHADKPFLGFVDLQGTTFTDTTLATGYGAYLARPLMRKEYRPVRPFSVELQRAHTLSLWAISFI